MGLIETASHLLAYDEDFVKPVQRLAPYDLNPVLEAAARSLAAGKHPRGDPTKRPVEACPSMGNRSRRDAVQGLEHSSGRLVLREPLLLDEAHVSLFDPRPQLRVICRAHCSQRAKVSPR